MSEAPQRRICWPKYDSTCLRGGCGYCNSHPFRYVANIEKSVRQRNDDHLMKALMDGIENNWAIAESLGARGKLCKCGCGLLVERVDRDWIPGHRPPSPAVIPPARQMELALGATPRLRKVSET